MPLIAAKCTQCGSSIQVDDTNEAGICIHCGTAFITEKAINNYNTFITNNTTQHITKNIYGKDDKNIDELIADGERFLQLESLEQANKVFQKAIEADRLIGVHGLDMLVQAANCVIITEL